MLRLTLLFPFSSPFPIAGDKKIVAKKTHLPQSSIGELEGKRWVVQGMKDQKNLVLKDVQMNQGVLVHNCHNCSIEINNKVNQITIESCSDLCLTLDAVISSCEIINCKSVKVQVKTNFK